MRLDLRRLPPTSCISIVVTVSIAIAHVYHSNQHRLGHGSMVMLQKVLSHALQGYLKNQASHAISLQVIQMISDASAAHKQLASAPTHSFAIVWCELAQYAGAHTIGMPNTTPHTQVY